MRIASRVTAPVEARAATTRAMEMLCVWQSNARILGSTASMLVDVSGPPTRSIVLPPVVGTRYAPRNNSAVITNLTYLFLPRYTLANTSRQHKTF